MKNNLKVLRAERDWSQADLAEKLNVSRQTINAIETEKYDPSLPLAFSIAKLFGKRIEEIFTPDKNVVGARYIAALQIKLKV
ncbi:MAG: helix-turn-helix transcriptional regulator [Anaerolineales bacterium]|nr:helix-turn-helix transcriptional regulator [Anaerolineales bacterium]